MSKGKFSIIIPAYSEEDNIGNLLKQIENTFKEEADLEVVLVDDGSPIALQDVIKKVNTT